jgi:hypothetical protein
MHLHLKSASSLNEIFRKGPTWLYPLAMVGLLWAVTPGLRAQNASYENLEVTNTLTVNGDAVSLGGGNVAIGGNVSESGTGGVAIGNTSIVSGNGSVSIGNNVGAGGADGAVAIGENNTAQNTDEAPFGPVAIGYSNFAEQEAAIAIGENNTAEAQAAVAIGDNSTAAGIGSVAMGYFSYANNDASVVLGTSSVANGWGSVALGLYNEADGDHSAAIGFELEAYYLDCTVLGQNNAEIPDTHSDLDGSYDWYPTDPIFEIGNGNGDGNSNALVVLKNGNTSIAGSLYLTNSGTGIAFSDGSTLTSGNVSKLYPSGGSASAISVSSSDNVTVSGSTTFTAPVAIAVGSATAPGLIFNGSANATTGLFAPANDTLALTTNGVERLAVDGGGNVAIGNSTNAGWTFANDNTLRANTVNSTVIWNNNGNVTNLPLLTLINSPLAIAQPLLLVTGGTSATDYFRALGLNYYQDGSSVRLFQFLSDNASFLEIGDNPLELGAPALKIHPTYNPSPEYAVSSVSTVAIYPNIDLASGVTTSTINGIDIAPNISSMNSTITTWRSISMEANSGYGIYESGTAENYFAGYVGIGNTTPSSNLTVNGTVLFTTTAGVATLAVASSGNISLNGNVTIPLRQGDIVMGAFGHGGGD